MVKSKDPMSETMPDISNEPLEKLKNNSIQDSLSFSIDYKKSEKEFTDQLIKNGLDWTESEKQEILNWDLDKDGIEMQAQLAMENCNYERTELAIFSILKHLFYKYPDFYQNWLQAGQKQNIVDEMVMRRIILKSIYLPKDK